MLRPLFTHCAMWLSPSILAAILCGLIRAVDGQVLSYITSVVTTCLDARPTQAPGGQAGGGDNPGAVSYRMPSCAICDCRGCTALSTFTTAFSAFCSTGFKDQTYTITETYVGMSSLPSFATPTAVPFGFKVAIETCNSCGTRPLTVTMTFPSGGSPFAPVATGNKGSPQTRTKTRGALTPAITEVSANLAKQTTEPRNFTRTAYKTIPANKTLTSGTLPVQSYTLSTILSSYGSGQGPRPTLPATVYSDQASSEPIPTKFLRVLMVLTTTIMVGGALGVLAGT